MTRALCPALVAALLSVGCTASTAPVRSPAAEQAPASAAASARHPGPDDEPIVSEVQTHRVGDYYVQRFSGSAMKRPYTLSEKVVARDGDLLVVDYALSEEGGASERLRVRRRARDWQVVAVFRVDGAIEREVEPATFHTLLEKTAFSADSNEAKLDQKTETCLVGDRAYSCATARYHVIVAGEPATLDVTSSDAFPGRDVSGAIRSANGRTIYRAELVEAHHGPRKADEVASARASR